MKSMKNMKSRMYSGVRSWNPFVGCEFNCVYCKPSFQRQAKRRRKWCELCYRYKPHAHPERLKKIPCSKTVFVCGTGDISFINPDYFKEILSRVEEHVDKNPGKLFYFQSKNPAFFNEFLGDFKEIGDNIILLTTLETNRPRGYEKKISKAPKPAKRFKDFSHLDWERKIVTIEPVMDFDLYKFTDWIQAIGPEAVYIGFNSRPKEVQLPEPSPEKFWRFVKELEKITEVRLKDVPQK